MFAKEVKAMGIQNNQDPYAALWDSVQQENEQEAAMQDPSFYYNDPKYAEWYAHYYASQVANGVATDDQEKPPGE